MKKRVVTVVLWFYVVWYAAAMASGIVGYPEALGPIIGAIAATVVAIALRRAPRSAPETQRGSGVPVSVVMPAGQQPG